MGVNPTMSKKNIEKVAFADKIRSLDCVLTTNVNRHEVEAELYIENPHWGMPDELLEIIRNPPMGGKFLIEDFSHVKELEQGGANITVYFIELED